ncbi:MAG: hypothetical protein AB8H79_23270 [Myxococcota bacterium]
MSLLWLLLAVDGAPTCEAPVQLPAVRATLSQIGEAAQARDIDTFRPQYTALQAQIGCLEQVVYPADAAALHAAMYLDEALQGDRPGMAAALLAATTAVGAQAPAWLSIPEGAEIAEATPWQGVQAPEHMVLFVDGVPLSARPTDRPALYQAVGAGGDVLWTRWLDGDEALPSEFSVGGAAVPQSGGDGPNGATGQPPVASGQTVLEEVTDLLAQGEYTKVVEVAVPAASAYPEQAEAFRAAADLAIDQLDRQRNRPENVATYDAYDPYAPRPRRGALRRGDTRAGFVLGFDAGFPSSVRGEWKIGGTAVDGVGVRIGGNVQLLSSSSASGGVDSSVYTDWTLTKRWQLETGVGIFFSDSGSPYVNVGGAVQYDPPNPFQAQLGVRVSVFGYVVPDAGVSFLW